MAKKYNYVRKTMTFEGKRYEVTGKTEQEALEKLAELKVSLQRGEKTVGGNSTVDRWFREWVDVYKKPSGMTAKSLGNIESKYRLYLKPTIGSMRLKDVREVHLQKILNSQEGMSYGHVSAIYSLMQNLFRKARMTRMIVFDPSEGIELPYSVKRTRRSITDEERKALLKTAETHRGGLLALLSLYAGLRPGESMALQWKDIDFEKNEIHVYKALESGSTNIKGPKTQAGVRDIPLHAELLPKLKAAQKGPFDFVLTDTKGRPLTNITKQRMWDSFKYQMDVNMGAKRKRSAIVESKMAPDFNVYCLRHTFCTDLQRAGVPINVAKELMGHANISVTANIYTHRDSQTLHANIQKLSEWKNGEGGKGRGKVEHETEKAQ